MAQDCIQRYEERPAEFEEVNLADFVAWWTPRNARRRNVNRDDGSSGESDDDEAYIQVRQLEYKRRDYCRVLRFRSYEMDDSVNYKREMVTLYVPFRTESVDILDRNKFLEIFDTRQDYIMERCKAYNGNLNLAKLTEELRNLE